jgi:hypothetical protein
MFCIRVWVFVVGAVLVLGASAGAAEPPSSGDTAGGFLRSFGGRAGATRVTVVVVCAVPDPAAAAWGGWVSGLAARIGEHFARREREAKDKKK